MPKNADHHVSLQQVVIFCNSNIKDHWSQITITDYDNNKKVWATARITKMWHRHKVSKCCWKNGTDRLARRKVATNLQCVKNSVSAAALCLHCQDPELLHLACSPFTLIDLCLQVTTYLMFISNPMSMSCSSFWPFSDCPHRKGSCEQCSLSSDTKATACSPYIWKSDLLDIKSLAHISFLPPFLPSFLPSFSFFLFLSSWMLLLKSLIIYFLHCKSLAFFALDAQFFSFS